MLSRAKRMPFSSALQYHLHFVLSGCLLLVGKALVTAQKSPSPVLPTCKHVHHAVTSIPSQSNLAVLNKSSEVEYLFLRMMIPKILSVFNKQSCISKFLKVHVFVIKILY